MRSKRLSLPANLALARAQVDYVRLRRDTRFAPILAPSSAAVRGPCSPPSTARLAGHSPARSSVFVGFGLAAALGRYKGPSRGARRHGHRAAGLVPQTFAALCAIEPVTDAGHWLMLDRPARST